MEEKIKQLLPYFEKFITWVTFKRAGLLAFAALCSIIVLSTFENRGKLLTLEKTVSVSSQTVLKVSKEVDAEIKDYVNRSSPDIIFMSIISTNIRINQREMVYFYTNSPIAQSIYLAAKATKGKMQPIFNISQTEDKNMVMLLNGEFSCIKYSETLYNTLAPLGADFVPYVCRISIPPHYGNFSGYISVGLGSEPDPQVVGSLKLEIAKIASQIYTQNSK